MIDAAVYLGRIICIADPAEAAARDQAFKTGTAEQLPPFPHLTSGVLAEGTPMAGLLAPHGAVRLGGREGRWDEVVGLGFCVAVRGTDPKDMLRPDQLAALVRIGAHVVGLSDSLVQVIEGKYTQFLDANGAAAMITRPDFYVFGGVADARELPDLINTLLTALASIRGVVPVSAKSAAAMIGDLPDDGRITLGTDKGWSGGVPSYGCVCAASTGYAGWWGSGWASCRKQRRGFRAGCLRSRLCRWPTNGP